MAVLRQGSPDRICLHHAAVNGIPADLTALKKRLAGYEITHSKKSWAQTIKTPGEYGYNYIEYHTAFAGNGHELTLQDDKYVLYHAGDNAKGAESFNLHGTAVLIDGNYMSDQPTPQQEEGFARYIARFQKKYKVDVIVRGHKQTSLSATSCPGTNLGDNTQGFLKRCITRANVILQDNLPTNPLQDDVVPPVESECEKRVKILEAENTALRIDLGACEGRESLLKDRVAKVEGDLSARDEEVKLLETEVAEVGVERERILEERARFEREKLDLQRELDELKQGRDDWINRLADMLHKLFGGK